MKTNINYSPGRRGAVLVRRSLGAGGFPLIATLGLLLAVAPRAFAADATPTAAAAVTDPQTILKQAVDEVLGVAYAAPTTPPADPLVTRLRPVLEKYFSFELITRSAVGPGWSSFKSAEQQRTITLFTDLVIRTYSDKFEPGDRPKVTYGKPVEIDDTNRRELPTTITYAGKNYAVSYRLRLLPEGWRIYDVNIEGVSMVANYRAQFDPLFQKGGAAAIIAALEKNLADFAAKK